MNNSTNASDSLQDSLHKYLSATYILITISVILAFFGFVTAGIICFFLLKHSKVTSVNLSVLMLVNLGVGIYNAFILRLCRIAFKKLIALFGKPTMLKVKTGNSYWINA